MPQISDLFGPIPTSIVLDGSGAGTVTFQPVGKNARITTLFVKASTAVLQANVSIYKGQVASTNIIGSTVSGSTGAPAFGNIDLLDGETLFVVWTGGDAGATATATFVGHTIPFDQVGGSELRWTDPVAANDGSLVFPAIKSPNFVAGVSGWSINRNGSVEFNDAVIRGSLSAGGGNVTLNSNGLNIHSSVTGKQFDINANAGFLARRFPDDGSAAEMVTLSGAFGDSFGGAVILSPTNPSTINGNTFGAALIQSEFDVIGAQDRPLLAFKSPNVTGLEKAVINLFGQRSTSGTDDSVIDLDAATVNVTSPGIFTILNIDGGRGWFHNGGTTTTSGAIAGTETTTLSIASTTYKANRAYRADIAGFCTTSANGRPLFRIRKDTGTTPPTGVELCVDGHDIASGSMHGIGWSGVFTIGGSDVTTGLVFTATGSGAFNVTTLGSPPLYVNLYDIGSATPHTVEPVLS